jgi:serine/threonine protein kinase
MERLGQSLTDIRNSQQGKWSWVTVASIGIRTLDIMEVLHKQLGVVHSDPHPGNWVLERDSGLSPHVRLIDFGDAKDVGFPGIAKLHLEDVQQLVYSLRYFYDGNMDYYAYKRAVPMDPSDLPAPYMHAFRYVCSLTDPSHIDYKQIRDYLVSIMQQFGASYRGGITWSPDGISHPFPPQNVKQRAPLIQKQVQPALSDFDKPSLAAETPSVASAVILLAITLLVFL